MAGLADEMSRNLSDRGGSGPSREVLAQLHAEDLARHQRGEPRPIETEIGDVRLLTSERIAELGERHGHERATAAIASKALEQLQSVKIAFVDTPAGVKMARVGDESHLTADDVDYINSRKLQREQMLAVHRALRDEADHALTQWVLEHAGEERGSVIVRSPLAMDTLRKTLRHLRKRTLADLLEQMETTDE